jgi:hypothetical protein
MGRNQRMLKNYVSIFMPVTDTPNIKYSKHNRVRFKSLEEGDKGRKMFIDFFGSIRKDGLGKKMRGHIILDSTNDFPESIVL